MGINGKFGTMLMYVISYVISMFNFLMGLVLFLVILPSFFILMVEVEEPEHVVGYVMSIVDDFTLDSGTKKQLEIESNYEKINNFVESNGYYIHEGYGLSNYELGELVVVVPRYDKTVQYLAVEYDGNHQSDALAKSYYDFHLAKIAEFSKSIGEIRINVATDSGESLGKIYNGLYVEETSRELPFIIEDSEG